MHLIKEGHLNTLHKDTIFINAERKYSKLAELGDVISGHHLVNIWIWILLPKNDTQVGEQAKESRN